MQLDQRVITRLETMFAKECQIAIDTLAYHGMSEEQYITIDTLAYHGMSEEQYITFETCLNTFFKYDDLKDFIIESLITKTKEVVRRFKPENPENWLSFRRLAQLIVKFGDQESLSVFSTFLLSGKLPFHFFILLEEIMSKGIETHEFQKIFESLIVVQQYDLNIINKYMSIVKQDAYGLTKRLVENSNYGGLVRYIRTLGTDVNQKKLLDSQIVPSVIEHYTGDRTHYMGITMAVTECGPDFLKELLHKSAHIGECEDYFVKYLISNHVHNMTLIKHLMAYLEINNPKKILSVEENLLTDSRPELIYQYGIEIPISNKRKVLIRLIELKNEKYLVEFIKKFPVYKSLMPML